MDSRTSTESYRESSLKLDNRVIFEPSDHSYRDSARRYPSVTWILAQSGLCDWSFVDEEIRARAMVRGRNVHWMLQLEDEGQLNYKTVPKALRPFRKAYLDWKRGTGFKPLLIEHPFLSGYGFAGTFDRYGILPPTEMYPKGSKVLIDLKTRSAHAATSIQLCAYSVGLTGNVAAAPLVRRIALVLFDNGLYCAKEFRRETWQHDWAKFIEAKRRTECLLKQS
jgi:hypothetical protein